MVAVWRKVKGAIAGKTSSYRWRPGICVGPVRGNCWLALPGSLVKAPPEQMREATREERTAW
eukprot:97634-Pyramimonas_sp.AAC.1